MILNYALAAGLVLSFVVAFTSVCFAIYSFVALLSTAYAPESSQRKKILLQIIPFLIVTPFVQPPKKRKYATRFWISLLCVFVSVGIHETIKLYDEHQP